MVKNWSKIVLVSMLVVIFATSLAYASTSRVRSLANAGNYMTDDSDVFRWYSTLPSYANMVQAEMGTWSGMGEFDGLVDTRALGFNYACGDDGKWGTYRITLLENATDHGSFWVNNPVLGMLTPGMFDDGIFPGVPSDNNIHPFDQTPINARDIAGGWDVNENIAIGVAINMSGWAYENKTRAHTFKADIGNYTFGVGGTWSNNEGTVVDAAFTYGMATGKLEGIAGDPDSTLEWDSKSAMDISARMFWDWKDFVTLVPVVEYAKATYSVKPRTEPNGDDVSVFMFGAGLNMDVNDDNMLIFALEVMMGKWSYANPDTAGGSIDEIALVSVPTMRLALETQINSWLTTRVGAAQHMLGWGEKLVNGDEEILTKGYPHGPEGLSSYGFEWTLGMGINVNEWTVDMELASETPFSVGYWLTGYSAWGSGMGSGGPVGRISATYNF